MSIEAVRQALVAQFEVALAAYVGTPPEVQYENRNTVDVSTQVDPYIGIEIVNTTGKQLDLNPSPMAVQYGQFVLTVFCQENSGARAAALLLDHFLPYLERKELGIVRTMVATQIWAKPAIGWKPYPLVIPFWWTRIVGQ